MNFSLASIFLLNYFIKNGNLLSFWVLLLTVSFVALSKYQAALFFLTLKHKDKWRKWHEKFTSGNNQMPNNVPPTIFSPQMIVPIEYSSVEY